MGLLSTAACAAPLTGVDLSTYVRVGRFDLPEPTRTTVIASSLLGQEASAGTYDWDTDTLLVAPAAAGASVIESIRCSVLSTGRPMCRRRRRREAREQTNRVPLAAPARS
jgi:hypothetical protein